MADKEVVTFRVEPGQSYHTGHHGGGIAILDKTDKRVAQLAAGQTLELIGDGAGVRLRAINVPELEIINTAAVTLEGQYKGSEKPKEEPMNQATLLKNMLSRTENKKPAAPSPHGTIGQAEVDEVIGKGVCNTHNLQAQAMDEARAAEHRKSGPINIRRDTGHHDQTNVQAPHLIPPKPLAPKGKAAQPAKP